MLAGHNGVPDIGMDWTHRNYGENKANIYQRLRGNVTRARSMTADRVKEDLRRLCLPMLETSKVRAKTESTVGTLTNC